MHGRCGARRTRRALPHRAISRAGVLLAGLALLGCPPREQGSRQTFSLERMLVQPRYDAYEAAAIFPDGAAMRRPPAGAVPRDDDPRGPEVTEGRRGEAWVTGVPVALDLAGVEHGRERFEIYCAACHGLLGDGASPVARAMTLRRPPSLLDERVRAMPDGRLYAVVRHGYGMMPGYERQLGIDERWQVVAYLRALQVSQGVAVEELPAALRRTFARRVEGRRGGAEPSPLTGVPAVEAAPAGGPPAERPGAGPPVSGEGR